MAQLRCQRGGRGAKDGRHVDDDDGLVQGEEQAVRAWLVQQGFEPGDLRSEKKIDYLMMTPIARACYKAELNVCKWLYNHGAAEDISRANNIKY